MIRYDIEHPVINDRDFLFWRENQVNCWPTIMIFGPDGKPIIQLTGEGNEETIQALLMAALTHYAQEDPSPLSANPPVPVVLEKDKHSKARDEKVNYVSKE